MPFNLQLQRKFHKILSMPYRVIRRGVLVAVACSVWGTLFCTPALATSNTTPEAETSDPKQRLLALSSEIDQLMKRDSTLAEEKAALAKDLTEMRQDMADRGKRLQQTQKQVGKVRERLTELQNKTLEQRQFLQEKNRRNTALIRAILRLEQVPPDTLLLIPQTPTDTIRSGIALKAILPKILAESNALKAELAISQGLENALRTQQSNLEYLEQREYLEQSQIETLLEQRQKQLKATDQTSGAEKQKLADLSGKAETLKDLIDTLEKSAQAEASLDVVIPKQKPESEADLKTAALQPYPSTEPEFGNAILPQNVSQNLTLLWPVTGEILERYGETIAIGQTSEGLKIHPSASSVVIAPEAGVVSFAGAFRSYASLIIIDHLNGYYSLISGLKDTDVQVGQELLEGEPIGRVATESTADGTEATLPILFEVRQNGEPIDPMPFLNAVL